MIHYKLILAHQENIYKISNALIVLQIVKFVLINKVVKLVNKIFPLYYKINIVYKFKMLTLLILINYLYPIFIKLFRINFIIIIIIL